MTYEDLIAFTQKCQQQAIDLADRATQVDGELAFDLQDFADLLGDHADALEWCKIAVSPS